jgi:heme/copper-type cytochrome/quinol oxidase subunit 3
MEIPYTVERNPETGLSNGKIGVWLFLTSEVMLFGALFATYIMLRVGAADWQHDQMEAGLSIPMATVNTIVLITSSVTMVMAWASLMRRRLDQYRLFLLSTVGLGFVFLIIKYFEYTAKFEHHHYPETSTFLAIYFTMTGLHALHVIGGMAINFYLAVPGAKLWQRNPQWLTDRVEHAGLFWHFVDLVWIFLFPVFYLL